jgi:hypothetical protein
MDGHMNKTDPQKHARAASAAASGKWNFPPVLHEPPANSAAGQRERFLNLAKEFESLPKDSFASLISRASAGAGCDPDAIRTLRAKVGLLCEMANCASAGALADGDPHELELIGTTLFAHAKDLCTLTIKTPIDTHYPYGAAMFAESAGISFERAGLKQEAKEAYLLASQAYRTSGYADLFTVGELQIEMPDYTKRVRATYVKEGSAKLVKAEEMAEKAGSLGF